MTVHAPSTKLPSNSPNSGELRTSVSWPWFSVGLIILAASLFVFFWAFSLDDLSSSRLYLLRWLLPLASGFICGCFAGSLRVSGPLGTLAVAATGGFAVWLLTFFFLPDPVRVNRLEAARKEIVALRGAWEAMPEGNPVVTAKVLTSAPELADQILRLDSGLNLGQKIDREEWAGYAYFMAADASHISNRPSQRDRYIDSALKHLTNARTFVAAADAEYAKPDSDTYFTALQSDITRCHDRERIDYLIAMTFALDVFGRGKYTKEQVRNTVRRIDAQRLQEIEVDPRFTPYVADILYPSEPNQATNIVR